MTATASALHITLHGVFMEVLGVGVLLSGEAAVGKSELALELISRGHRLIADDSPEFSLLDADILTGSCPDVLKDFLEVRGLGILDIRAMFGDAAVKQRKYLRLIIELIQLRDDELESVDRLRGARSKRDILGVNVPSITLPIAPGRSLAVLVEAAIRDQVLRMRGYEADQVLAERQRSLIERNTPNRP